MSEMRFSIDDLPQMKMVEQVWQVPPPIDIQAQVDQAWLGIKDKLQPPAKGRIAVGVGSRGIANLVKVVTAVVAKLKEAGYQPFIIPAMGSHGGATAEGQIEVLEARGITEASVGAPVEATMEVVSLGETDGIPLFINRLAHEADGYVVINRIKPHTNFYAPTESGMIKMMAIGLGCQHGASHYHKLTVVRDYGEIIGGAGRGVMERSNLIFGVGLIENQDHETCGLVMATKDNLYETEVEAMKWARSLLPGLPADNIDLLIIDEMGKDISGAGMDPNVVGREVCTCGMPRSNPTVHRIMVRDVTEGSEGSVIGVGTADFTVKRLVDKIDYHATSINCLTSCSPEGGRIPLYYDNDQQTLAAALMTLRPCEVEELRVMHIKNTLEVQKVTVSQAIWAEMESRQDMRLGSDLVPWNFDADKELISPFVNSGSH